MKVGGISRPPFTSALMPATACSGATERPWPNAMVTVLSSPQRLGTSGSALSGSSVRKPVELAELLQEPLVVLDAHASAMRAVPMFEE